MIETGKFQNLKHPLPFEQCGFYSSTLLLPGMLSLTPLLRTAFVALIWADSEGCSSIICPGNGTDIKGAWRPSQQWRTWGGGLVKVGFSFYHKKVHIYLFSLHNLLRN